MRTPAEVAKQIKSALAGAGIRSSVRSRNYQIHVTTDGGHQAETIAKLVYHQEPHAHLIVWVGNKCLPMPPIYVEEP